MSFARLSFLWTRASEEMDGPIIALRSSNPQFRLDTDYCPLGLRYVFASGHHGSTLMRGR